MNSAEHFGHPLAHSGDSAEEGWYALRQRAAHALTRFAPHDLAARQEAQWHYAAHWSLLPAELWETEKTVEIDLEAPGMAPDDFEIQVVDDVLIVRGTKAPPETPAESRHFVRERAYGIFERTFHLPAAVDDAEAHARYSSGVLRVSLPKSNRGHENRIIVESA